MDYRIRRVFWSFGGEVERESGRKEEQGLEKGGNLKIEELGAKVKPKFGLIIT
ncbi:hypothetical protein MTR_0029s0120 [Medicago truncatula]|uniref:Uncharacterized protein n=1 Tax=Medicago truncatula TaxID=3880 RepID=G7ZUE4_MEDTR|nr:hypothetical protein MTR_0029s0120 [Medicago truncatula]